MSNHVELSEEEYRALVLRGLPMRVLSQQLTLCDRALAEWRTPARFKDAVDALSEALHALEALEPGGELLAYWRAQCQERVANVRALSPYVGVIVMGAA